MNSLPTPLFASAITVCLFSAGLMRDHERRSGRPYAYFVAFLGVEMVAFVFELLASLPSAPFKALWLGLWMSTSLLVAPCLWLAIRENADGKSPALSRLDRRHAVVVVVGFFLALPLIATSHGGTTFDQPGHSVSRLHSALIHAGMLLCVGVFAVQVPVYLLRCRKVLVARSGARPLTWLQLPLLAVGTSWAIGLLRTLQCAAHGPQEFVPWFALVDVGITVTALYLVVRRASSQEAASPARMAESFFAPSPEALPESKYAKSRLDDPIRQRIKGKLSTAMAKEALYRDSLLSLRTLSQALKENPHYVSQVINQDLGSSFYELVNRHRIEEAIRLLASEPERTVLEIALSVGFNSKSTFNAAFRANTGTTPRGMRGSSSDPSSSR